MSESAEDFSPPRGALIGAAVLMAAAFIGAVVSRTTDVGAARLIEAPMVQSRMLTVTSASDGSAVVTDAGDGSLVRDAKPGAEDGFIWGAINGLSYGRKQIGGPLDAPYELSRRADDRLVLTDTVTGQKVFLKSFGSSNAAAWARLLEHKEAAR